MHSRGSSFAWGIQSAKPGWSAEIGINAAHEVVRRRSDRKALLRHIQAILQARGVDVAEVFSHGLSWQVGHVQEYSSAGAFSLSTVYRTAHLVPCSELIDEPLTSFIDNAGSFAP